MARKIRLSDQTLYIDRCIICQKKDDFKLVSGATGREKILSISEGKKDDVYIRLLSLDDKTSFKYHNTYSCYKKYTKKSVDIFNALPGNTNFNNAENENRSEAGTRQQSDQQSRIHVKRSQSVLYSKNEDMTKTKCIICDTVKCKGEIRKYQITDLERARSFLKMVTKLQDEVFDRLVVDIQSPESLISARIYYHKSCLRSYELRYTRKPEFNSEINSSSQDSLQDTNVSESDSAPTPIDPREAAILEHMKNLELRLYTGEAFELSNITNEIKKQHGFHESFNNRFVKNVLITHYGENIHFVYPSQRNKSLLVCYSKLSQSEMINLIRSTSHVKACATLLRNVLQSSDFNLENKYCDEHDLRLSWSNIEMPDELKEFFSTLFNIDANRLQYLDEKCDSNSEVDMRAFKIKSLYQIMYYIMHNGRKRTPLHVLTGLSVHHTTKSKTLVASLHRTGLSISYDEVERYRNGLASYTARSAEIMTPLPSHFSPHAFTTAAFDNFDHEEGTLSGLHGTHDTVSVLFQEQNLAINRKPELPKSKHSDSRKFDKSLKCQIKKDFVRPKKEICLPANYFVNSQENRLTPTMYNRNINSEDLAWLLCRLQTNDVSDGFKLKCNDEQTVPSWAAFNSIFKVDNRPSQCVGFLPVLPHPVTEYDTVYTAMCNFNEILQQLDQKYLPVTSDEGVYKIARHIQMLKGDEMDNLVLMLGGFHMTKVVFGCLGKFIKGSGVENVLIETGLFGINVTDQLLSGSHYNRAVKGYFFLGEALSRLQLQAFFTKEKVELYEQELQILEDLTSTLSDNSFEEGQRILQIFNESSENLRNDFNEFVANRSKESPLFKYWNIVLIILDLARDLIRADRQGDWKLHVATVEKLQPLFQVMDRVNYSRWSAIYLEDIKKLEKEKPEVHAEFMNGRFTVKQSLTSSTSVATDQALEQTINRTAKSTSGIIGLTKKKNAVAAWNMTFHEMVGITSFYKELTGLSKNNDELKTHHEFNPSNTSASEQSVFKIIDYLVNHINPFKEGNEPLRDLVTQELVNDEITKLLFSIFESGCKAYNDFRQERIVEKKIPISATIHRNNLPSFKATFNKEPKKTIASTKKAINQSHRIIDIARERNYDINELFTYELTSENMLFDETGLLKKENNKSQLTHTLEKLLDPTADYNMSDSAMNIMIDVMLVCRKIRWKNLNNFGDFANAFCDYISRKNCYGNYTRIDFVNDSYFEKSPKSSERMRRAGNRESIILHEIKENTPLPAQEEKFWSAEKNKENLQLFLRQYILENCTKWWPEVKLVFSTIQNERSISTEQTHQDDLLMLQRFDIEEADVKMMLHILHSSVNGNKKIFLLSSDTDVLILALNFWHDFAKYHLQELWMHIHVKEKMRNIPIHTLAQKLGSNICTVLIAAHHLTGADYSSKVGTKLGAIRANPENYLQQFGRGTSELVIQNCIVQAERYLIQVLQKDSICNSFDELRSYQYHHSINNDIYSLPPTSASIRLHILRAFYVTYVQTNCLNEHVPFLNPLEYGYVEQDDLLMPEKVLNLLPPFDEFVPNCLCKACSTKACCCVKAEIPCCSFCACKKKKNTCKNKFE